MSMMPLPRPLALAIALMLAMPALAQDAAAPDATPAAPPATGSTPLSMGAPAADGPGSVYTEATHGDWEQRCVRTEDGSNPCRLYQLLKDPSGNPVAEISMFGIPEGQAGQAVAGATIVAPLETLLTENLTMGVDAAPPKTYPFSWCSVEGCVARLGFTAQEVAAFKAGNVAKITIVPVVAPDQKVVLDVSLKGFTAGLDAVNAANAN